MQDGRMPIEGNDDPAIRALPIVFGAPIPGEPLWCTAQVPDGWTFKYASGGDHHQWHHVANEKGEVVASVYLGTRPDKSQAVKIFPGKRETPGSERRGQRAGAAHAEPQVRRP